MIFSAKPFILALAIVMGTSAAALALDPENTLYLDLKHGRVEIELLVNVAPKTVAHIKELVRKGFYDGTPIHRVIPGFMAQMGDPTGTGTGGSGETVPAEFSALKHERGIVSMARSQDINSADSQFFICFAPAPNLDGKYTIFGRVVSGMEFVDKIKAGDEADNGIVLFPDKIVKMELANNAE
jgi:peptidylprolyl isomerase